MTAPLRKKLKKNSLSGQLWHMPLIVELLGGESFKFEASLAYRLVSSRRARALRNPVFRKNNKKTNKNPNKQ